MSGNSFMLTAQNIAVGYNGTPLCERLDFSLTAGQVCAVIGHNGAGKSTLVRTLLGIQAPLSGTITWADNSKKNIAYLGQSANIDTHFPMRVKDAVTMGVWPQLGFWQGLSRSMTERVDAALMRTGLTHMADRPLFECSAGQLQRCFFARAIVQDSNVIILDEPFTAIDQTTESQLIEIITQWRAEGRTLIIVLHDLSSVMGLADHCLLLGDGRGLFGKTSDVVTHQNLIEYQYLTMTQAEWISRLTSAGGQNA